MTEATETAPATTGEREEAIVLAEEIAPEGRYIPYGGGCMGWFENSGVMKTELPNNYLFYTVLDGDLVRTKQFQRWGERFNRRGGRTRYRKETGVTLVRGKEKHSGTTKDLSAQGMRLQLLEEVSYEKGEQIKVQVHAPNTETVLVELEARVIWSERVGKIRPVVNLGLSFAQISPEDSEKLKDFITQE